MSYLEKKQFPLVALVVVAMGLVSCPGSQSSGQIATARMSQRSSAGNCYVQVTYFHHTLRCPACEVIEILSRKTVEQFLEEESAGVPIRFRTVNIDLPENRHYQEMYQLDAPSLVISLVQDDAELNWTNLRKVWDLYEDEHAFEQYVREKIRETLRQVGETEN